MKLLSNLENLDNVEDGSVKTGVRYIDLSQYKTSNGALLIGDLEPGLYINSTKYYRMGLYMKLGSTYSSTIYSVSGSIPYVHILKKGSDAQENEIFAEIPIDNYYTTSSSTNYVKYDNRQYICTVKKDTTKNSGLVKNETYSSYTYPINKIICAYSYASYASSNTKVAYSDATIQANTYFILFVDYNNSAKGALSLNINSGGAKPLYHGTTRADGNGIFAPTFGKGTYIMFYDGTNYYYETDGTIPKVVHGDESIKRIVEISYADYKTLEANNQVNAKTEYHIPESGSSGSIETIVRQLIQEDAESKHPVGSLEFNTSGANPATYLGFGTWEAWGSGKVPVGIDTNDTDFNASEKSGGSKTASTSYTPAGVNTGAAVNAHTYTPQGVNTGGSVSAHSYTPQGVNTGAAVTLNAVTLTHSGGAVQSHTLTLTEMPKHTHTYYTPRYYYSEPGGGGDILGVDYGETTTVQERATLEAGGGGGHSHGFTQPNQHSFTPSTKTVTNPTFTGTAATLSHTVTQPTFSGTQATLSHTVTQPTFAGTQATITESTVQPYITCYMWKRTA